jgi:hypothetical protein
MRSRYETRQQLVNAVSGECRMKFGDRAAGTFGINPVHCRFVSLAAGPHRKRRRGGQKREAVQIGRC